MGVSDGARWAREKRDWEKDTSLPRFSLVSTDQKHGSADIDSSLSVERNKAEQTNIKTNILRLSTAIFSFAYIDLPILERSKTDQDQVRCL